MILGVISDTHDNVPAIKNSLTVFESLDVDTILHCGDYIAPPTLPFFDGFELHGVLGNNDGELDGLELFFDDLGNESHLHGRYATLEFDGLTVRLLHGDQGRDTVIDEAESGAYDVVCYGHFHETDEQTINDTIVVNPGGHFPTVPDEHRCVVTIDTATATIEFHNIA